MIEMMYQKSTFHENEESSLNRKQRRSLASRAGAATKARLRHERDRLAMAPTKEGPSGLASWYELIEMVPHGAMLNLINSANSYLRYYRYGPCTVIVSKEHGRYHLSVAHPSRYPTWLEISGAWYKAVPDAAARTGALILPPIEQYINIHSFCMQVLECPPQGAWDGLYEQPPTGGNHAGP